MRCLFIKKNVCHFPREVFFFFPCYVKVRPVPRHHFLGFSGFNHEPSSSTSRRTTRSISATSWESCSLRNVLKETQGRQKRKGWINSGLRLVECRVLTQTNSEVSPMWSLIWDDSHSSSSRQWPSFDVIQSGSTHADCMSGWMLNANSYRSSASPPIQTGLFSLESRL